MGFLPESVDGEDDQWLMVWDEESSMGHDFWKCGVQKFDCAASSPDFLQYCSQPFL